MSWSFKVVGHAGPKGIGMSEVAQRARKAVAVSYPRPAGDQANLDKVLQRLDEDAAWHASNDVPTTFIEAEGYGHWDDASGSGNYSLKVTVFADRRRTPIA